ERGKKGRRSPVLEERTSPDLLMDYFNYLRGELRVEDVPVQDIAEKHGTPVYIYSGRTILEHYRKLRDAFAGAALVDHAPRICYSVKANSNLSILKLMKDEGSG